VVLFVDEKEVLIAFHMLLNKGAFENLHRYQQSSRHCCVNAISIGPNAFTKTFITWLATIQQLFNGSKHLAYQSLQITEAPGTDLAETQTRLTNTEKQVTFLELWTPLQT